MVHSLFRNERLEVKLSNGLYDVLKWTSIVLFPALSVLYATLAPVWGFENVEQVVITINAIGLFIGAIIGLSNASHVKNRYDGTMNVFESEDKKTFDLHLDEPPEVIENKGEVIFKVKK